MPCQQEQRRYYPFASYHSRHGVLLNPAHLCKDD
uniref:Uncharacterized protein n=1 Tax=Anguilla anguilla TaxID=7936 RepID=A0A0E9SH17_ANGAN